MTNPLTAPIPCRVLFLMPQKARALRVHQLIQEQLLLDAKNTDETTTTANAQQHTIMEFLTGVATFGSYKDNDGTTVRYLMSVDYIPETDGQLAGEPQSLVSFFDEAATMLRSGAENDNGDDETDDKNDNTDGEDSNDDDDLDAMLSFPGISAVALGAGVHEEEDVAKITAFFQTMSQGKSTARMKAIEPNAEFSSMKEELRAFKELTEEEKESATQQRTMGPAKMAQFTIDLGREVVQERLQQIEERRRRRREREEARRIAEEQAKLESQKQTLANDQQHKASPEHVVDRDRPHYACRKCRTILFGDNDMEDPPHSQSQHSFSIRKAGHGQNHASSCQSFFLQDGISWMGEMSDIEGRIDCPKCSTKLGNWHWSGAQCSCGTWVVPAIQIPKSKVDQIVPMKTELPSGAIVSPFAQLQLAQASPGARNSNVSQSSGENQH